MGKWLVAAATLSSLAWGYDGKVFSLAIGGKVTNDTVIRGTRTKNSIAVSPLVYLAFLDERIQFFGTSLEFLDFVVKDNLRARTKFALLMSTGIPTSVDWTTRFEWFWPTFAAPWVQLDLAYTYELRAHNGQLGEATARVSLFHALVEPQLFGSFGYGDSRHNRFWYGAAATDGPAFVEAGLMLVIPKKIDRHFPVLKAFRYEALAGASRPGGWHVEAIFGFALR